MKKLFFVLLLLTIRLSVFAQQSTTTISKYNVGALRCKYLKYTEPEKADAYMLYCSFHNRQYQHIVDIGSIAIGSKSGLDGFIADLQGCLGYMDSKEQNVRYDRKQYSLCVHESSKTLYVYDRKKHAYLSEKHAVKLIAWLETIEFPE